MNAVAILRCASVLFIALAAMVGSAAFAQDKTEAQVIRDTFIAGTTGNAAVFRVLNRTGQRITGVRMTPSFPLQWIRLTGITPQSIDLAPEEVAEFEIEFLIYDDAPDKATETVTLFFTANEDVDIRNPQFNLIVDIVREPDEAHFVLSVEGQGFAPFFDMKAEPRTVDPDGTVWIGKSGAYVGWEVEGMHEMWMTLEAGDDHDRAKESLRRYLLSEACRPGADGQAAGLPQQPILSDTPGSWSPTVWLRGPRIVTVAGPFASRADYTEKLRRTWRGVGKPGTDKPYLFMKDLVARARAMSDCGGNCCDVVCEDPFHCE